MECSRYQVAKKPKTYALSIFLWLSITNSSTVSRLGWYVKVDTSAACLSCNRILSVRIRSKYFWKEQSILRNMNEEK